MSCPYFKESCFGTCGARDAIHVPSIDEMERFCFSSWYFTCPIILRMEEPEKSGNPCASGSCRKDPAELAWRRFQ
jgi:hypothetical protein